VAAVTLALGCKEVAVSAPLILLLYDRAFLAGSVREAWGRRRGMYLGLLGAWFGFALLQSSSASRSAWAGYSLPVQWHEYARSQFGVILHYLRLSLWPRPLVLDYWWPVASGMREILPAAVVVGTLAAASVSALVRRPKLGFLGAWFFLILAPTSSIMPLSDLAVLHRMYLPLAAIVVLAVLGGQVLVDALVRRRWLGPRGAVAAAIGVVAAVATSLAFGTWQRNRDYAGTISIWRDTVANAPRNPWAHYNLGIALAERGFAEEAIWHLQKSVEIQPGFANAHYNLGIVLNSLGRVDEAIAQYRQVLEIQPDHAEARNNLGNSLDDRGQSEEAMAQYRQVLSIRPLYADAHYNLGLALARRGLTEAAIAEYRTTLAIQPGHAGALRELTSARPALQKR
jgi:tetratricopeptide (TPR) repeat protein